MVDHIKIGDVSPRVQYAGDGVQTVFIFPFPIFSASDLKVYVDGIPVASGFSVTGAGESAGGDVTFDTAPTDGASITLVRELTIERTTDFQEGGAFRARSVNDELDRQTAFIQQVDDQSARSVQLHTTDPSSSLTLPSRDDRANRLLGFDETGALQAVVTPGFWRGDWTTGTAYQLHDSIRDPVSTNLFVCVSTHISGVFATDTASGKWQLAVDVGSVATATIAAETAHAGAVAAASSAAASQSVAAAAEALAEEWAENNEDVDVTGHPGAYSAKHWAAKAETALAPWIARANQTKAEAGTDNTTYMSPLRTAQHVNARIGTATGDLVALENVGGTPGLPAVDGSQVTGLTQETFRAKAGGGAAQPVAAFIDTKVQFPIEDWDLNNSYDTATYRFTPKVAGKYVVIAHLRIYTVPAEDGGFSIAFKKNGVNHSGSGTMINESVVNVADLQLVDLVDLNGTTDYVEWYAFGTVPFEINSDHANTNVMAFRIAGD